MSKFYQVIDDLEVKDIPLQGGLFTWRGGQNNRRLARLDRFLVTEDWNHHFGGVVQCVLPRPVSNHSPILLERRGGTFARGLF